MTEPAARDERAWLDVLAAAAEDASRSFRAESNVAMQTVSDSLAELAAAYRQRASRLRGEAAIIALVEHRTERIGRNEALFREVNERLKELGSSFDVHPETADFVCECGSVSCTEAITMPLAEYERVRENGRTFATITGHELVDVETVVEDHGRWQVVEKHEGGPARLAEAEDPRSD